jgi:hypothetical protein
MIVGYEYTSGSGLPSELVYSYIRIEGDRPYELGFSVDFSIFFGQPQLYGEK